MGVLYMINCKKCGYSKKLFAGGGRNDCMPNAFMKELPEAEKADLENAVSNGGSRFSINRRPCVCMECGEVYAIPVVKYQLNDEEHTLTGKCPKCHSQNVDYVESELSCPKCGENISLEQTGLWD